MPPAEQRPCGGPPLGPGSKPGCGAGTLPRTPCVPRSSTVAGPWQRPEQACGCALAPQAVASTLPTLTGCWVVGGADGTKELKLTIDDGHHDASCVRVQGWAGIASPGVLPP